MLNLVDLMRRSQAIESFSQWFKGITPEQIREVMKEVNIIMLHRRPHLDELVAAAMVTEMFPIKHPVRIVVEGAKISDGDVVLRIGFGATDFPFEEGMTVSEELVRNLLNHRIIDEHLSNGRVKDCSATGLVTSIYQELVSEDSSRHLLNMGELADFLQSIHYGDTHGHIHAATLQAQVKGLWDLEEEAPSLDQMVRLMRDIIRAFRYQVQPENTTVQDVPDAVMRRAMRKEEIRDLASTDEVEGEKVYICVPNGADAETIFRARLLEAVLQPTPCKVMRMRGANQFSKLIEKKRRFCLVGFDQGSKQRAIYSKNLGLKRFLKSTGIDEQKHGLNYMLKRCWSKAWDDRMHKGPQAPMMFSNCIGRVLNMQSSEYTPLLSWDELMNVIERMLRASMFWSMRYEQNCPDQLKRLKRDGRIWNSDKTSPVSVMSFETDTDLPMFPNWLMRKKGFDLVIQRWGDEGNVQIFSGENWGTDEQRRAVMLNVFRRLVRCEMEKQGYDEEVEVNDEMARIAQLGAENVNSALANLYLSWGSMILNGSKSHPGVPPLRLSTSVIRNIVEEEVRLITKPGTSEGEE